MNKFHKESRNNLLTQQKKSDNNFINKQKFKLGRLKSQENLIKLNKIDIKTLQNNNNQFNPPLNDNIIIKRTIKKIGNKNIAEILNKNKNQINRKLNLLNNNTTKINKKFFNNKGIFIEQGNDVGRTILTNALYDDIKIRNIINLWNELEVKESYRKYFFFIYKELSEEDKSNFYRNEINELIQLKNDIKNLTYNIELRIGIIKKLSELNDELNQANEKGKVEQITINEIIKKMEDLTIQAINIVKYMKKIKTIINLFPNLDKYDMNIISKKFNFDKNYVIKMKFETDFLKEGCVRKFINIKNDQTPFIINIKDKNSYKSKDNENNDSISLEPKIIDDILDCNYFIYMELISYENGKMSKNNIRCISPIRKNTSAYNFYTNINFYTNGYIKQQENKMKKLNFPLTINKKKFISNAYTKSSKNNFFDNRMNNSARHIKTLNFFSSENSSNNRNSMKINFDDNLKHINSVKIKEKNNKNINFQNEFNKNLLLLDQNINDSEFILPKKIEHLKIGEKFSFQNDIESPTFINKNKMEENS